MTIDGWECTESYVGMEWQTRTARRRHVEFVADSSGLDVTESGLGYEGGSGSYSLPANVLMWLVAIVR